MIIVRKGYLCRRIVSVSGVAPLYYNKIDYEILNKRVEYLIEKLDSLEDFVNFDPADFLKRLTKVEAMLFTSKEMLTSEEACYYLGISMSQLYKMTSAHTIPHYKPRGKQVYFCKKELDEWMKNDPVVTIQDALKQSSLYFQLKKEQRNG